MAQEPGLERAEWLVFHGAVDQSLPVLDELHALTGRPGVYARWLRGVALGACGRYGEALDTADAITPGVPEYSMARSLRGSLLRQIGCHDLAVIADREAMSSAATPGAAIEAMTGLAADAVGLEDVPAASASLSQARGLLERVAADPRTGAVWWRHHVRLAWVECEVALLESRYQDAVTHATLALDASEGATAPRHVAKSLLFVAVAEIQVGHPDSAIPRLRRSLMLSTSMGFLAVAWPAHAVLAALLKPGDPEAAHQHFVQASAITNIVGEGLTGDLARRWDARADIMALHKEAT